MTNRYQHYFQLKYSTIFKMLILNFKYQMFNTVVGVYLLFKMQHYLRYDEDIFTLD